MNNLNVTLNQYGIGGSLGDNLVNHYAMLTTYVNW